jgi:poly(A) polymerase
MATDETRRLLAALTRDRVEARFVGGCVRDAVIGRPVKDIDVATPLRPETVTELLAAAGIKVVPTGIAHGTVTAVIAHRPYEITTLRRDVETYGRHAKVAFTDDWEADAARRDFTMNALSCRPSGEVFDYFGGLADLRQGRVRFVGDARDRIREDVLRLLRFYRFVAHYGHGSPDGEARAACRALAPQLGSLSAERLRDETMKLLRAPAPHHVLLLMREDGVLAAYLPEANEIARLARLVALEQRWGGRIRAGDSLRRLAALLSGRSAAHDVGARLRFSNKERERLEALCAEAPAFDELAAAPRRACYRHGPELVLDRAALAAGEPKALEAVLSAVESWTPAHLPIKGEDVMALGVPAGEGVGAALRQVEDWWIERDFRPGRDEALAQLRAIVRGV